MGLGFRMITRFSDYTKNILTNRNILILIVATFGMLPELVSVGGYYQLGDSTHQLLPFVYETKRMFESGIPLWSWNTYFGDNFIASYAYYTLFNPFVWINCLFPYKYIGVGFTLVVYLKFMVCGYISQVYLRKIGFGDRLSIIGCMLYTFSSWAITNLYYYFFVEPMILMPFLLIFVERYLREEPHPYTGLISSVFIVVVVNYYFAPINLIAASIFFLFRLIYFRKRYNGIFFVSIKALGCVIIGVLCASFVLIPVLFQLKGSPQLSFNFNSSDIFLMIERVVWLIYPKTFEGVHNYIFFLMDGIITLQASQYSDYCPLHCFIQKKNTDGLNGSLQSYSYYI